MKILHIITGLRMGGAEMSLLKLLEKMDRNTFNSEVISLTDHGVMGKRIEDAGVPVLAINMRSGIPDPAGLKRLYHEVKKYNPDIVQTWMYHADLLGGLVVKMAGIRNIVWNIRNSDLDPVKTKLHTRLTVRMCALLSHWLPGKIICNSYKASEVHIQAGYQKDKLKIIPNGFDLLTFQRNSAAKKSVFEELGLSEKTYLVGLFARFDPQKDHNGFIQAARKVNNKLENVHYLLCGSGIDSDNHQITSWIKREGLEKSFHLIGVRADMPRLTAALDVACSSSSYGEAFPNVIGEAMSCSIPCIVTDVGDSAWIIGDTGKVVPPDDPQAMADALVWMLSLTVQDKQKLAEAARKRIEDNFSINNVIDQYEKLYLEMAG